VVIDFNAREGSKVANIEETSLAEGAHKQMAGEMGKGTLH